MGVLSTRTLLAGVAAAAAAGHAFGTGPGNGPWRIARPEDHGLSSALLEEAAFNVAKRVPERYCLVVTKDGNIVHETYYANTSSTPYETDSLAKTATALVVGAAIHAGLFDLDTPLVAYGVKPFCLDGTDCWKAVSCPPGVPCPTGPDGWFPNVTARSLLAQSSGCVEGDGCKYPPGTAWTYDSGQWIQHLSYVITKTSGTSAVEWATVNFMSKIGLPTFYLTGDGYPEDDNSPEITAGGGMLVSCRDAARLAQIILDKGVVTHPDGTTERLIGEDYIEAMLTPQYPSRGFTYGLLTWLNAKRDPTVSPACCAPRWGPDSTCRGKEVNTSLLGDDLASVAPHDVGIAMGWLGQYLYVVPSRNVSITTMGSSWGSSVQCPVGATLPTDPAYNDGYDDGYSATEVWIAVDAATTPGSVPNLTHSTVFSKHKKAINHGTATSEAQPKAKTNSTATGGSCSCRCPPGRLTGRCYNLPPGETDCSLAIDKAGDDCPATGVVRQCHIPQIPSDTNCSAIGPSMRGDIGSTTVWGGHVVCSLGNDCSISASGISSATCICRPVAYGDYGCTYSPHSCDYNGYMLPGTPVS